MAILKCEFRSDALGMETAMNVILPQDARAETSDGKLPVLYLLHGLSDSESAWIRKTPIERYALGYGIAVIMPDGGRSFYTDMAKGYKYWTFMTEELPRIARSFFPLSGLREYNYVAGLSMGGYGAFKMALGRPDLFAAGASLSGALDMAALAEERLKPPREEFRDLGEEFYRECENIFGDLEKIKGSGNDLFHLAKKASQLKNNKPALYFCCGTEDFLYESNIKFKNYCAEIKLPFTYEETPGEHTWAFWDEFIQKALAWLPIPEPAAKAQP